MPGVLLIQADDLRWDISQRFMHYVTGTMGMQGTTFANHRVSVPICSPARAGLTSGAYAFRPDNGVYLNDVTDITDPNDGIANWINPTGLNPNMMFVGKYTIPGQTNPTAGWSQWRCLASSTQAAYEYVVRDEDGDDVSPVPPIHTLSYTYQQAAAFVSGLGAPPGDWLCWWAPTNPHLNDDLLNSPLPETIGKFDWFNWEHDLLTDTTDKPSWVAGASQFTAADMAFNRRMIRLQIGEAYDLDTYIEQLVAAIPLTHIDDTTIIFTSDSGTHYLEHRFGLAFPASKGSPYDVCYKAPLVIMGPDFEPGKVVTEATTLQDITKTIVEIMGATPPYTLDGLDLRDPIPHERAVLYEHTTALSGSGYPPGQGVTTGTRTFVRWEAADPDQYELYDNVNDPGQKVNRAYDGGSWLTERNALEAQLDAILGS